MEDKSFKKKPRENPRRGKQGFAGGGSAPNCSGGGRGGQSRRADGDRHRQVPKSKAREVQHNGEEYCSDNSLYGTAADSAETGEDSYCGIVAGRNSVRELLRSGRSIDKLFVRAGDREGSVTVLVAEALKRKIPVVEATQEKLDSLSGGVNHQGVVAMAAQKEYTDIDSVLAAAAEKGEKPLIVIADGIEDPHNMGALIRCAECSGAHGVVIPKRRSCGITPVVVKASAGAIEHMAVVKVANIAQTVESLKKKGLWVFASEAGGADFYEADFNVPAAIVFGSEGEGISRTVKDKCDFLISIPMYGKVNSLNVSTAASVILSRAARMQRGASAQ